MIRQIWLGMAGVLMGLALFQAPTAHVHFHADEHQHGGLGHGHWGHQASHHDDRGDGAEWELIDEDETAVSMEWTPEPVQRHDLDPHVEATLDWALIPALVALGSAPEYIPNSHSPPRRLQLPARAPPA